MLVDCAVIALYAHIHIQTFERRGFKFGGRGSEFSQTAMLTDCTILIVYTHKCIQTFEGRGLKFELRGFEFSQIAMLADCTIIALYTHTRIQTGARAVGYDSDDNPIQYCRAHTHVHKQTLSNTLHTHTRMRIGALADVFIFDM